MERLPDEILNQIVMFSVPKYPYHKELKNIFKWYDTDGSIFDCIRLLTPWEGDFLTYRYCHFQRIYDEEL